MGESSTTLHLIVKTQLNVIVEPDLLVADFGSNAEFTCKAYRRDEDEEESQGEKKQSVSQICQMSQKTQCHKSQFRV